MAKKIFLTQIHYTEDHAEKILPIGILAVGSALKRAGFTVELVNINEKEINETAKRLAAADPLYVGLSVMTGVQTKHSADFSKQLKKHSPSLPIVWGGIHPSLLPEQCLKEEYIDYVVISEGEISIVALTQKLINGEKMNGVLGIGFKENNHPVINGWQSFISNLDDYPIDWSLINPRDFIFPLGRYRRVIAYKASRGCPFNCSFCYNNAFNKNRWRFWSEKMVISDIRWLKEHYQIDAVKFYDDNFFVDKNRAIRILEAIDLPAHLEVRIDSIDDSLAAKLKALKVFDMLIGVESGSDRLLKLIDKKFTVEMILAGVKIIAKHNLPASYSAIVGLPTETKAEFEATVDLFYRIYQIHRLAGFTLGAYLPYPGSKMYDFAVSEGFQPPEKTEDWGKIDRFRRDFSSPWVDAQKVWRIREYFKMLNWQLGPVIKWFKWRIEHRFFVLPFDIYLIEFLAGIAIEQKGFLGKIMRRTYNLLKK